MTQSGPRPFDLRLGPLRLRFRSLRLRLRALLISHVLLPAEHRHHERQPGDHSNEQLPPQPHPLRLFALGRRDEARDVPGQHLPQLGDHPLRISECMALPQLFIHPAARVPKRSCLAGLCQKDQLVLSLIEPASQGGPARDQGFVSELDRRDRLLSLAPETYRQQASGGETFEHGCRF